MQIFDRVKRRVRSWALRYRSIWRARPPFRPRPAPNAARAAGEDTSVTAAWGDDGFTFGDLLDLINPLQHLPVISTLYRKFTGDEIAPAPRLLGDGLFGGPLGAASAAVGVAVEAATGKDIGDHVLALFDGPEAPATTAIAWAAPPVGAVDIAARQQPAAAVQTARAEIAPDPLVAAAGSDAALAARDTGLVPADSLLALLALNSADGADRVAALRGDLEAGATSASLSAIELARLFARYQETTRNLQDSRSVIDSTL